MIRGGFVVYFETNCWRSSPILLRVGALPLSPPCQCRLSLLVLLASKLLISHNVVRI